MTTPHESDSESGLVPLVERFARNDAIAAAWRWIEAFRQAWCALNCEKAELLESRGFDFWGAVLHSLHAEENPESLAEAVSFVPRYFERAYLVQAFAWIESFRASWMENYPDPEDVDDYAITLLWGPVLFLEHGSEDPIELGCDMPVPNEFSRAMFPFDIHPGDPGHPWTLRD